MGLREVYRSGTMFSMGMGSSGTNDAKIILIRGTIMLMSLSFVLRVLTYVGLKYTNRDKQI